MGSRCGSWRRRRRAARRRWAARSRWVGLAVRRSRLGGRALVNVRFLRLARLAELLGGPVLAAGGGRPLTPGRRAETVRALLAADPGPYPAEVAAQPATVSAV